MEHRDLLMAMFDAALAAAQPSTVMPSFMPEPPKGRTVVIGAGKASAAMAKTFEDNWQGGPLQGLVITRYDYSVACKHIAIVEAGHPVPDAAGESATRQILEMVSDLMAADLVVCLISGGGSALLTLPAPGLSLHDKQSVSKALLKSGATIAEMNCVRKHLSSVKGGRLATACAPAKVVSLIISDVPGDDLSVIASGPTVSDPTTFADALGLVEKYKLQLPAPVLKHLHDATDETLKPGDTRLRKIENHIVATPQKSLEAAANVARLHGYRPMILGDSLEGEAKDVALVHAGIVKQVIRHDQPINVPCVLLSGGKLPLR